MFIPRSITYRLIVVVTLSTTAIFSVTLGFNYIRSRALLEEQVENTARNLALALVNRVEAVLGSVTKVTEGLGRTIENGRTGDREWPALLRRSIESNPEIHGAAIALEPSTLGGPTRRYATYYYRDGDKISSSRLERGYDYVYQDWYQIPRELGRSEWSEPYYREGGSNVLMATLSVPFYAGNGETRRLKGIVTSDIALDWLTQTIGSIKVLKTGFAFLLSRNGTVVTHPMAERIMNETIFSLAEACSNSALRDAGRRMVRGESGFVPYTTCDGLKTRLYYAPVPSAGWTLALLFPEDELFADVRQLTLTVAAIGLVGILLIALVVVLIARSITRPLRALAHATRKMSGGDFDVALPTNSSQDEVGALTRAFAAMNVSLQEHIRQLVATTSARERIESELQIAHDIQMSILPKMLPPFSNREEFNLFAVIEPAKEVGGDFYDFFEIDGNHLCLVIADVSGKGVPAALFMAVTKTLIKATAKVWHGAADILAEVNSQICRDNELDMFVTVFCGILDLQTGELIYANAGHNSPLLIRRDGVSCHLPKGRQLVLGAMEDHRYQSESVVLEPGDRLFLYTDGVTEAMNPRDELYSEARLEREVMDLSQGSIYQIVDGIIASVRAFAGTAPQSDDITIMLVEYRGKSNVV